ncbi:MAG: hypothetical protein ACP5NV_04075 [Candidatus Woesearchaeota archaeon]
MELIKDGSGDYYLNMTLEDIARFSKPVSSNGGFKYELFVGKVAGSDEKYVFMCTNNSSDIYHKEFAHDEIFVEIGEEGLVIMVHPRQIYKMNPGDHIMTRYDGHSNKIWITCQSIEDSVKK